jgi:hypothetical protein
VQALVPIGAQDLYGAWKGKFSEDVNLYTALGEIRHAWEVEWDEGKFFTEGWYIHCLSNDF